MFFTHVSVEFCFLGFRVGFGMPVVIWLLCFYCLFAFHLIFQVDASCYFACYYMLRLFFFFFLFSSSIVQFSELCSWNG